jgi:hypothetical protein
LDAGELYGRFRQLPPVDPRGLRDDIDATVDQRLPGDDERPTPDDRSPES